MNKFGAQKLKAMHSLCCNPFVMLASRPGFQAQLAWREGTGEGCCSIRKLHLAPKLHVAKCSALFQFQHFSQSYLAFSDVT